MVQLQGGDPRIVDDYGRLPAAPSRAPLLASRSGYVTAMRAEALGIASNVLGAGRAKVGDPVDHAVGLVTRAGADGGGGAAPLSLCRSAIVIGDQPAPHREHVIDHVS